MKEICVISREAITVNLKIFCSFEDFAFSRWGVEFEVRSQILDFFPRFKFSHEAEKNTKHFQIELALRTPISPKWKLTWLNYEARKGTNGQILKNKYSNRQLIVHTQCAAGSGVIHIWPYTGCFTSALFINPLTLILAREC